jgi:hypothetical protein
MADRQQAIEMAQKMASQGAPIEDIEFMVQQSGFKSLDELNQPDTSLGKNAKVAAYGAGRAIAGVNDAVSFAQEFSPPGLLKKGLSYLLGDKEAFNVDKILQRAQRSTQSVDQLAVKNNAMPETAGQKYLAAGVGGAVTAPLAVATGGMSLVPALASGVGGGLGSQAGVDLAQRIDPNSEGLALGLGVAGGLAGGLAPTVSGKLANAVRTPQRNYAQSVANSINPQQTKQVAALLDKSFARGTPLTVQEAVQSTTGIPNNSLTSSQAIQAGAGNMSNNKLAQLLSDRVPNNQKLLDTALKGSPVDDALQGVKDTATGTLASLKDDIKNQVQNLYKSSVDESTAKVLVSDVSTGEFSAPIKTAVAQVNADRAKLGQTGISLKKDMSMPDVQAVYQKLRELSISAKDNRALNQGYSAAANYIESKAPAEFKKANTLRYQLEQDMMKPYEKSLLNKVSNSKSEAEALNKIFPANPTSTQIEKSVELATGLPEDARKSIARAHLQRAIDASISNSGEVNMPKLMNKVAGNRGSAEILSTFAKGSPLAELINSDTTKFLGAQLPAKISAEAQHIIDSRRSLLDSAYAVLSRKKAGDFKAAQASASGSKGLQELLDAANNPFNIKKGTALGGAAGYLNASGSAPDRKAKNKKKENN